MTDTLQVVIPLFEKMTALDAIGPYEVLQRIPTIEVTFVGAEKGEVRTENGMLGLNIDATFEDLPEPDILVFPGGVGTRALETDQRVLDWIRHAHRRSRFTTSVCTGSLVLGAAGLLNGLTATTHWSCYEELAAHGATPTPERVVEHLDRRIITSAGVSSGIDMALRLVKLLFDTTAAQAAQLMIEYDPRPPYDCGSIAKAGPADHPVATDYTDACPIVTVALEVSSVSEVLRQACSEVLETWITDGARHLTAGGIPFEEARCLIVQFVAMLEGAFILCRAKRDTEALLVCANAAAAAVQFSLSKAG